MNKKPFEDGISIQDIILEYVYDSGWKDYRRFANALTKTILSKKPKSRTEFELLLSRLSHPFFAFNGISKNEFSGRFPFEYLQRQSEIPRLATPTRNGRGLRKALSPKLRVLVMERDGFRCQLCGKTAQETKLEVDHKTPVAKGGTDSLNNLWTLCFDCNRGKSDLSFHI